MNKAVLANTSKPRLHVYIMDRAILMALLLKEGFARMANGLSKFKYCLSCFLLH
jgi:hypothetical protein